MDAGKGGGGTPPPRKDGEKKDDLVQWLQWAYAALRPLALALALAALVFHTARIAAGVKEEERGGRAKRRGGISGMA